MLRLHEQRFIGTEEAQNRTLKADEADSRQNSQHDRTRERRRKIPVLASVVFAASAFRAENHTAADAHQQTKTVYDIPDRRHYRQSSRSLRSLVLPDHRHIHNAVYA